MYSQYDVSNRSRGSKDSRIHFIRIQSLREDELTEFHKPCIWALLQTIDSTMEMTYVGSLFLNSLPNWFLNKHMLSKIIIDKGIRHIKLMKRPPLIHRQRENNTYRDKADHRGEGLLEVNLKGLREPTSNEMSFVSMNRPVRIILECKHLSTCNRICVGRSRFKYSCP